MAYHPGEEVPISGIYNCENCGNQVACSKGDNFPPCSKHCKEAEYTLLYRTPEHKW